MPELTQDSGAGTNPDERLIGTQLGPYRVEAIAGYGGMGAVYSASRNDAEYFQKVAIKLVRAASESRTAQHRFRQERQILARLSHPNIACLLDGGSTPENVPYLVMEFIEGVPITTWCDRQSLSVDERVRIFLPVCDAVETANRQMVIHRDLKPANILVTGEGVPKLLDFGIAKLLDIEERDPTFTATHSPVMTPEYASPEQVRGNLVTAATDVYSLGLVLYEILTLSRAQSMPDRTPHSLVRVICQAEPPRPAALKPHLKGDLDNIIRKAIRKEPERRYQTAADLAADLRSYLAGHPVTARPSTFGYQAQKVLSRNRTAATTALVSAAVVLSGVFITYRFVRSPRPPRVLQVAQLTHDGVIRVSGRIATDGSKLYFNERSEANGALAQVPVDGGVASLVNLPPGLPNAILMDISPDRSRLLVGSGRRNDDEELLWTVPIGGGPAQPVGDISARYAIWSRDGKRIFFLRDFAVFQANLDGTDCRKIVSVPAGSSGLSESRSPQEDVLRLTVFAQDMRSSSLWQVALNGSGFRPVLGGPEFKSGLPDVYYTGTWDSSGSYYLFRARRDGTANFWAVREKHDLLQFSKNRPVQIYSTPLEVRSFTPSVDGKHIYFAAAQERLESVRYNSARRQFLPFLAGVTGRYVSLSRDQQNVAYTSTPQDALWKCRIDGGGRMKLTSATVRAFDPQWSPDGSFIAFTGSDGGRPTKIYVVPSSGGTPKIIGSFPNELTASWSPDGKSLLFGVGLSPGTTKPSGLYIADLKSETIKRLPGSDLLTDSAWSPNPRYIAASRGQEEILLFDFHTGRWKQLATSPNSGFLFWSRDGMYIYFQGPERSTSQPISRVRISDGRVEKLMGSNQVPQSDVTGFLLDGLTRDDEPIANVSRSNSDIYSLDVDLP